MTVEDYDLLPEIGPRYQLIEGELHLAPTPNRYHQEISGSLSYVLMKYLKNNQRGEMYHAPLSVYLDFQNAFQPDILFVSNERRSILKDEGIEGVPDFIAEILSPKTARLDRDQKRKVYAAHGVPELWIIAPETRTIEVYSLSKDPVNPVAIYDERDKFESAIFPGLKFDAARIFAQ